MSYIPDVGYVPANPITATKSVLWSAGATGYLTSPGQYSGIQVSTLYNITAPGILHKFGYRLRTLRHQITGNTDWDRICNGSGGGYDLREAVRFIVDGVTGEWIVLRKPGASPPVSGSDPPFELETSVKRVYDTSGGNVAPINMTMIADIPFQASLQVQHLLCPDSYFTSNFTTITTGWLYSTTDGEGQAHFEFGLQYSLRVA